MGDQLEENFLVTEIKTIEDKRVADFYSKIQYPGPDSLITYLWAVRLKSYLPKTPFVLLDAGCGAGRHTAGFLDLYSNCTAVCLDAASDSLEAAETLFEKKGFSDRAGLLNQSYLEEITLDSPADCAIAIGTIHHCPNPKKALVNIVDALKPGGILGLMVYSDRSTQQRYEIKEAITLLGLTRSIEETGKAVRDYRAMYKGILDKTLRTVIRDVRNALSHRVKTLLGIRRHGYRPDLLSDVIVADGYLSPIDVSFNTMGLKELIECAHLEVVDFVGFGRMDESLLPSSWREKWQHLDFWEKVRIMELIDPSPTSWSLICRKPS